MSTPSPFVGTITLNPCYVMLCHLKICSLAAVLKSEDSIVWIEESDGFSSSELENCGDNALGALVGSLMGAPVLAGANL